MSHSSKAEKLFILDSISYDAAAELIKSISRMQKEGNPPLEVHITSGGGEVTPGLAIYDAIRQYPGPTKAVVTGYAHSMAAVVVQAFGTRSITKHSRILIHHISKSISLDILRNKNKLEREVQDLERMQKNIYHILSTRTKQPLAVIKNSVEKTLH